MTPARAGTARSAEGRGADVTAGQLLGIGAAAAEAGVSERALRYYQEIGLLTPSGCTPGGLRRYSEEDLARVARIRQLQAILGLNLDEIAVVLHGEDRLTEIRHAYHRENASDADRRELVEESLQLQQHLRATVESKRQAIEGFLADLDARITRTSDLLRQMTRPGHARSQGKATAKGRG